MLELQELYKTNFPSSCKTSSLPSPVLRARQTVLLSFPRRIRLMPSSSKYKKSTALFEVNEVHMGRPLQVSTKLPFFRKCNLYLRFLDWRFFPLAKIPLRKHFSFWHLPKNDNKSKGPKMETQKVMLKKTEEGSLQYYFSFKAIVSGKKKIFTFQRIFPFWKSIFGKLVFSSMV